jgi:cytochrome c553
MNKRNILDHTSRLLRVSGVVAAFLVSTSAWGEGDAGRGWARAQMCAGCHGIADYRTAYPAVYSVPKLGGQEAAYIVKSLQDYKSGARKHPTMSGIAATLSDQDMADLAAYYVTNEHATNSDSTPKGQK